jgi:hypothetical protein
MADAFGSRVLVTARVTQVNAEQPRIGPVTRFHWAAHLCFCRPSVSWFDLKAVSSGRPRHRQRGRSTFQVCPLCGRLCYPRRHNKGRGDG